MLEFLAAIEKHLLTIRRLIAGSASITDSQLRATPIDVNMVSGTVTIGSELEIMNDAGNPIPVNGTVAATQSGNWDVTSITNPVTVNVGLTDAELRATPVPVSVTGMGDATAANQTTIIGHLDGVEALLTTIDGDTSTLAGIDYATETTVNTLLKPADTLTAVTTVGTITNVVHVDDNGGSLTIDATTLPLPTGASTEVTLSALNAKVTAVDTGAVTISSSLPAGVNNIGDIDVLSVPAPLNVIGTGAAATALRVHLSDESLTALENISVTIPGTVDLGTVSLTALETITVVDGGNSLTVDNSTLSEIGGGLEATALRVTIASDSTGLISIDDNGGSITVDGTVTANLGTIAGIATEAKQDTQITALNSIDTKLTNPISIDDNGGSITVDGTLTVVATDLDIRNLTHTADSIMIGDGTDYLAIDGSGRIGVTNASLDASLSTLSTEATLATVETNTDYGTVTGGGTEAGSLRVTIANDSTGVLSIDDNGGSITIDGTITANAGTNLNTSALALETTLQSVKTAVETIDNAISGNEMQVDVLTLPTISPDLASISYDAGARQRVSQLTTLGDYKILNADRSILIETAGTGTGNFINNTYTMTVTNGQYLIRQSKRYHPYLSGKSQLVEFTFENFNIEANVIKRIGYFSSNAAAPYDTTYDGIYLENDGTDIRFRITRAGTTVLNVTQANWNVNTLGGHDWSKFNVVLLDFLWLGGAVVRLYVKTATGFQLCHVYSHASAYAGTMTLSPNQPIRYEIRGNGAGGTMTYICAQVSTEGSIDEAGTMYGVTHSSTGIALSAIGTTYPIIGIRKKTTHRDVALAIMEYKLLTASNADQIKLWLLLNPTLSAPLTYSSGPGSIEYAFGNGTITVSSTGTVLNVGFSTQVTTVEAQSIVTNYLSWLGSTLNNTMDEIILAGTPITATITTHSCLTLKEY